MYGLLGVSLGFAAFLVMGGLGSLAVAAARPRRGFSLSPGEAGGQARSLFALRLLPAAAGLVFAAGFYAPAYLLLEPRDAGETVSPGLALLVVAAAGLVITGLRRGLRSWVDGRRLAAGWLRGARPLDLVGLALPAYRIAHRFPVVAVVGMWRPRLFVAESVLAGLTSEELEAVLAHEEGHLLARDNLRGFLLRCCPDLLALLPIGNRLFRAWTEAAEAAADEHAARAGSSRALALAGALVKVARMAPPGQRASLPASAFHDGAAIALRVKRLLDRTESKEGATPPPRPPRAAWALAAVLALTATSPLVLRSVHALTEAALRLLR
ncbi:MAG TPA: M48 family metalloprotease [Vicinamibacteria bacterium]|jgi:Zn-dependent protease with chaperone function|nr:M48 family metalloprotease [Vicinamibacteria bacterium]